MFEFDPNKDKANIAKHGVSLAEYGRFEHDFSVCFDIHVVDGEEREVWAAPIGDDVHVAVITMRGRKTRVISLRLATAREVRTWRKDYENG